MKSFLTRRLKYVKRQSKLLSRRPYRLATARHRVLPDFLILGMPRSGTSSLYSYIGQHPQVIRALTKEVQFFGRNYAKGENWYRSNFPLRKVMGPDQITGEATPGYLTTSSACEQIKEMLPEVKMICLLRNPTSRSISYYFLKRNGGYETMPMLEAMQADYEYGYSQRKQKLRDRILGRKWRYEFCYKELGQYVRLLERYWAQFDRSQILVLCSEKFFANPQATLRRVFDFLEIDPDYKVKDLAVRAAGKGKRDVDPGVYEFLNDYFRPYNEELYEALGEDFGW